MLSYLEFKETFSTFCRTLFLVSGLEIIVVGGEAVDCAGLTAEPLPCVNFDSFDWMITDGFAFGSTSAIFRLPDVSADADEIDVFGEIVVDDCNSLVESIGYAIVDCCRALYMGSSKSGRLAAI